eukprot:13124544-Alexandrium_andersonii.AAC.1
MPRRSGGAASLCVKHSSLARRSRGGISLRMKHSSLARKCAGTSFTRVRCTLKRRKVNRVSCELSQEAWGEGRRRYPGGPAWRLWAARRPRGKTTTGSAP